MKKCMLNILDFDLFSEMHIVNDVACYKNQNVNNTFLNVMNQMSGCSEGDSVHNLKLN